MFVARLKNMIMIAEGFLSCFIYTLSPFFLSFHWSTTWRLLISVVWIIYLSDKNLAWDIWRPNYRPPKYEQCSYIFKERTDSGFPFWGFVLYCKCRLHHQKNTRLILIKIITLKWKPVVWWITVIKELRTLRIYLNK